MAARCLLLLLWTVGTSASETRLEDKAWLLRGLMEEHVLCKRATLHSMRCEEGSLEEWYAQ